MGFQLCRFGTLYLNDEPMPNPSDPRDNGDIPRYPTSNSSIQIRDTVEGKEIIWVKPDNMNILVADRTLLTCVSWNDLENNGFIPGKVVTIDGRRYQCRLLQVGKRDIEANLYEPSEWKNIVNLTIPDNGLWHWQHCYFWGQDAIAVDTSWKAVIGYNSPIYWAQEKASNTFSLMGFRPALEPLPPAIYCTDEHVVLEGQVFKLSQLQGATKEVFYPQLSPIYEAIFNGIPDGSTIEMYSLLVNGEPVRQDNGPSDYIAKADIRLSDEFYGEEYLIPWTISNGVAVANRPLLEGDWIS